MTEQLETPTVKRSIARLVGQLTILAACSTVDYRVPSGVTAELRADLHQLAQLENVPLVVAAKSLVEAAIEHSISPNKTTHANCRVTRDALGDLMIHSKVIKGK